MVDTVPRSRSAISGAGWFNVGHRAEEPGFIVTVAKAGYRLRE